MLYFDKVKDTLGVLSVLLATQEFNNNSKIMILYFITKVFSPQHLQRQRICPPDAALAAGIISRVGKA